LYGKYPKDVKFQNSEYRGHRVGPKDSESQNFNFLAFTGEAVGKQQRHVIDGKKYRSNYVFSHKKVQKRENQQ
jgi:hypothetical protein